MVYKSFMKKVLILSLGKKYGGAEKYTLLLVEKLKEAQCDIYLAVRSDGILQSKAQDVTTVQLDLNLFHFVKSIAKLQKYILSNNIQVLHCNGINAMLMAVFMKCSKRISVIHGDTKADHKGMGILKEKVLPWLEIKLINRFDACVAVSNSLRNLLISRGGDPRKITVVYNGISFLEYEVFAKRKENSLKICCVGNLLPVKNQIIVLKALKTIQADAENIGLDIVTDIYGTGECKNLLEKYILDNQLAKVQLMGFDENVRKKLNQYNLFVQPSKYESFGIAIIEALNAGCYVVGSNIGGIKEIRDTVPDRFCLFDVDDYQELAKIILGAATGKIEIEKKQEDAIEKLKQKFSSETMAKEMIKMYGW